MRISSNGRLYPTRLAVALVIGSAATPLVAQPFPANNVSLHSWLPLSSFTPTPGNGNDCWGYVSASGREYALMGLSNQLAVIEITNPAAPTIVGSISHSDSLWADVKVYGNYCYVSNETGGGIDVVDLSNVDSGTVTLVQRFTGGGASSAHNVALNVDSGYLYLCGANINGGALVAVSLADPANPAIAGSWTASAAYTHDSQIVTYTSGPYAGREIAFCADGGTGFDIVDVTTKSAMFLVARRTYPSLSYCHQGWLSEDRNYFYINDETDGINRTTIFDVSDIDNPVIVGEYSAGVGATDHNQYVLGNFMYEADYHSGLRIFCLDDPLAPLQVGYFDTYPEDNNSGYEGAWSVFPYFPSGNVIISDIDRGFFVVDPSQALTAGSVTFSYPDGRPALLCPDGGTRVRVNIAGSCGATLNAASPQLHYDTGSGFVSVPLEFVAPGEYDAVFPALPCQTQVSYYVSADSNLPSSFTDPAGAPASAYSAVSATDTAISLTETFEAAGAWTVGDPSSPDTATTGIWSRNDPQPTAAQPGDDHTPGAGTMCWVTDYRAGTGVGTYDVDNGKTTLRSPTLDLSMIPDPWIGYWRWYSNTAGSEPNQDIFTVDISSNDGSTWTNAETVGPAGAQTAGGWFYHEFRVTDFVTPNNQIRLRFVAADVAPGSIVEAAIDDFQIFTYKCCLKGDANEDGVVDSFDIQAYTNAFLAQPVFCTTMFCNLDMDSDHVLEEGDDVEGFVNCLLNEVCP